MNLFIIKNNNFKQLKAILDGMINGENEGKLKITITTKVKFKNLTKLNMFAKFSLPKKKKKIIRKRKF